jgi:hypothetical protein
VQPLLLWKSSKCYILWVCVFSLRYPACNAHAPYCHLWPTRLYKIFPHYLINGMIFGKKKILNTTCTFWFSLQLLSETFLILRWNKRGMVNNVSRSSCEVPVILVDFNETWTFSKDFRKKKSKYQSSWNSVQWQPSCSMRTDRGRDMTKLIVTFRNFVKAPKIVKKICLRLCFLIQWVFKITAFMLMSTYPRRNLRVWWLQPSSLTCP